MKLTAKIIENSKGNSQSKDWVKIVRGRRCLQEDGNSLKKEGEIRFKAFIFKACEEEMGLKV